MDAEDGISKENPEVRECTSECDGCFGAMLCLTCMQQISIRKFGLIVLVVTIVLVEICGEYAFSYVTVTYENAYIYHPKHGVRKGLEQPQNDADVLQT